MGTTEKIAKYIVNFNYDSIPPKGLENIKGSILDSMGVALLGCKDRVGALVANYTKQMGGEPQATLWGVGNKAPVSEAAFVNGVFTHAIDYDDGAGFGHHGAVLVPAAMALGEMYRLSGKKILEAYAVTYEVGNKLLKSLGEIQSVGGLHATTLLGTICSAIQSAKLLDLDIEQTRHAMGIACCFSSGMRQAFGYDAKSIQVGRAAQNGIVAALLARDGGTGDPNIFEETQGFYYVYGQQQADIKKLTENIGIPLAIATQKLHFKQWPCCGGNYEALTAIYDLLKESDIPSEQIVRIDVATSWQPPGPVTRSNPTSGEQGRFSLEYNVATALIDKGIDLNSFSEEKYQRPELQALMKKVKVTQHPDTAGKPLRISNESRFIIIDIALADGRVLSKRQNAETRYELGLEGVYGKYADNAGMVGISEENIQKTINLVLELETCADVTELVELFCIR